MLRGSFNTYFVNTARSRKRNDLPTGLTWPTDIDGVVGHHVFVVVEPVLKVVAALLVPEKLLQQQIFSTTSTRAAAARSCFMDTRNISARVDQELAYHLYGAVDQLRAERPEGGDEVKGEGVGPPPEAYQEANSDSPQHRRLSDHLVDRRPVPVNAAVTL